MTSVIPFVCTTLLGLAPPTLERPTSPTQSADEPVPSSVPAPPAADDETSASTGGAKDREAARAASSGRSSQGTKGQRTSRSSQRAKSDRPVKPLAAEALAAKVQRFYDALEDFQAEFFQVYTRVALSRTIEQSGTLTVKKGGKIRWAYEEPGEKLFVANGETLWVYEPEEQQVIVDRGFSPKKLGSSLAFLWGQGSLTKSFEIGLAQPSEHEFGADATVLELVPKADRTYRKLLLLVDPDTGRVDASVVHETSGNTNRFRFRNMRINQGIPDSRFEFVPPAGVDVVPA